MQQFFSSRVCCDFCESFGREMSLNERCKGEFVQWCEIVGEALGLFWTEMDQKSFARDDFSAFSKLEARKNPRAKKKVTSRRSRASLYISGISGSSEFLRPACDFCHFGVVWNFGSWYPGNLDTGGPCFGLVRANVKKLGLICEGNILDSQILARSCD